MPKTKYDIASADLDEVKRIANDFNLPKFLAYALVGRGLTNNATIDSFFNPDFERDWSNPYIIPGMKEVADSLEFAIRSKHKIVIFGDFDVDGITATCVMIRALRILKADVYPFIPMRTTEGYGITKESFGRMLSECPDVKTVVTVDNGISSAKEVNFFKQRGINLIITDHHEPGDLVPCDVPVCDPKIDPNCSCSILSGVAVALKVVQIIASRFGKAYLWKNFLDFAMLGTIADLMPMQGENRALCLAGIDSMRKKMRPCFRAMFKVANLNVEEFDFDTFAFKINPRLNAAGRVSDPRFALKLLLQDDYNNALTCAYDIEEFNKQRKELEKDVYKKAVEKAQNIYSGQRALVLTGRNWHDGVKGIVASRIVEIYGVPVVLFSIENNLAFGSGRTAGRINLLEAIQSCSKYLERFGGHKAAAGITILPENLADFEGALIKYLSQFPMEDFHPHVCIDAPADISELTIKNVEMIKKFEPFGQENKSLLFILKGVNIINARLVGKNKNHFSCSFTDGRYCINAIKFNVSNMQKYMQFNQCVDAVGRVYVKEFRGKMYVNFMLQEILPCNEPAVLFKDVKLSYDTAVESAHNVRKLWKKKAQCQPNLLIDSIIQAIIGNNSPHASQLAILDKLIHGVNTLGVMATGRGKSLIFHVFASYLALGKAKTSLFVYPLRALISDQVFHLNTQLSKFGIVAQSLTGESSTEDRKKIYNDLSNGKIDILLTTPEFLEFNAEKISKNANVGFFVVDESHHIRDAKSGTRESYSKFNRIIQMLGNPTTLALTATASNNATVDIVESLNIKSIILDKTTRENLYVIEAINTHDKLDYMCNILSTNKKTIIYVNSRSSAVDVARKLRAARHDLAMSIGFYHAGLEKQQREYIEQLFRSGKLMTLVSTSAFGEGIDIPDIRNVVLFHMPFSETEFNQMCGRAGRDQNSSIIHLIFNKHDSEINLHLLNEATPKREKLVDIYKELYLLVQNEPEQKLKIPIDKLESLQDRYGRSLLCGLSVFSELGFFYVKKIFIAQEPSYEIHLCKNQNKVELVKSVRYREGLAEHDIFNSFKSWVLQNNVNVLRNQLISPIVPTIKIPSVEIREIEE